MSTHTCVTSSFFEFETNHMSTQVVAVMPASCVTCYSLSGQGGGAGRAFNSGTMCLQHFGANNSLLPRRSVRNHGRLRSPGFPCWPFWRAAGMPAGVPHAEARNTQAGDECQRRG